MTFLAPAFLIGLAALPLIVWLHRRRQRPAAVDVPSLMFLEGETAESLAPERMRFDAELILSLLAATLLAVAAAGPAKAGGEPGRRIRVVVDRGPSMEAKAGDGRTAHERADEAVETIRGALRPADRLEVVEGDPLRLDLVSLARVAEAGLRIVVSDRLPSPLPTDVRVVAVGDPNVHNVGIVAVDAVPDGDRIRVFTNVWNDGPGDAEVNVRRLTDPGAVDQQTSEESVSLRIPAASARSVVFSAEAVPFQHVQISTSIQPADDLPQDNGALLFQRALLVAFAPPDAGGYPAAHRAAVTLMLDLLLTPSGWREVAPLPVGRRTTSDLRNYPDLWVGPGTGAQMGALVELRLHPIAPGGEGSRAARVAPAPSISDPIERDIDFTGCDLVFAAGLVSGAAVRPIRTAREVMSPLIVDFLPDPLAGHPAPVDHPSWPIFMENVVRAAHGEPAPLGFRKLAPDPRASRLGRDVAPFEAKWLDGVKTEAGAAPRNLRPFAVAAALLLFAALWGAPLVRARRRVT